MGCLGSKRCRQETNQNHIRLKADGAQMLRRLSLYVAYSLLFYA